MANGRFILRFKGTGPIPAKDIERIRALPDVDVLDSTSRMLLVEAEEDDVASLIHSMPEWVLSPEQTVNRSDPRPKIMEKAK
jgi:uncharacterized protein YlzI (FlbEa/FlbD family)